MNKSLDDTNYVIEDNFNFYEALEDSDNDDDKEAEICLISQKCLDENAITLNCNHKFNFFDIYKEVVNQKKKTHSLDKNIRLLKKSEFLCPYCRSVQKELLPHIKNLSMGINFYIGVNSPHNICMPYHECSYKTLSGKSKGVPCGCPAFSYDGITHCNKHYAATQKKLLAPTNNNNNNNILCCAIMKSGKNIGGICGVKIKTNNDTLCGRHKPKPLNITT
jgi:hypothetical protein